MGDTNIHSPDVLVNLVNSLQSQISSLTDDNKNLKEKVNNLESDRKQKVSTEYDILKTGIQRLKTSAAVNSTKVNNLERENCHLQEKCRKLELENEKLKELTIMETKNKHLKEIELKDIKEKVRILEEEKFGPLTETLKQLELINRHVVTIVNTLLDERVENGLFIEEKFKKLMSDAKADIKEEFKDKIESIIDKGDTIETNNDKKNSNDNPRVSKNLTLGQSKRTNFSMNNHLSNSNTNTLIMQNIPESTDPEDDRIKVKKLLLALDVIETHGLVVSRLGARKDGTMRDMVVIFQTVEPVNAILKKLDGNSSIYDTNIHIVKSDG